MDIKKGGQMKSSEIVNATFCQLNQKQRREAYITMLLILRNTTYKAIAKRHRISSWYVSACARGSYGMTPRVQKLLEKDLQCDLSLFLLEEER